MNLDWMSRTFLVVWLWILDRVAIRVSESDTLLDLACLRGDRLKRMYERRKIKNKRKSFEWMVI